MANYDINYDDQRFAQVESDKGNALSELEQTYAGMIGESDNYYQAQIDASKQWADKQSQLQQEQTDFNIEQIEQQKAQAQKDYTKEQSGAYVDWRKQSNQYGSEAEKMASAGLANTGFSESSQVSMYNTYQNRFATARESFNTAVLNYNNAIKDARLQNNAALAEIAYKSLQTQLELSLHGFQYKNNLILEQANKKTELENTYYNRYLDVLNQINHENAMAEEIRQYNQNYELQMKNFEESVRQFNQNYELKMKEYNEGVRQFEIEIERLKKKDADEYQMQIKELELKKQQLEEEKRQYEEQMALKREQFEWEKAQTEAAKKSSGGRGSGSGGGSGGGNGGIIPQTSEPSLNLKSILDLGRGPLNGTAVAKGVKSGDYGMSVKDNQVYVTKNTNTKSSAEKKLEDLITNVRKKMW
jgi:hypothetical protein